METLYGFKRVKLSEIVVGETYYRVSVGLVSEIKFLKIGEEKGLHTLYDFEISSFWGDLGVHAPGESYGNELNILLKTREDAEEIIRHPEYKAALESHWEACSFGY